MLSQLGPLFKTQFRQAESNDTRQYIPHEERDNHRRKNEEENKKTKAPDAWTDDATVSVVSLKAFLIDFLKTLPESADSELLANMTQQEQQPARPKEQIRPTNTHNAKAVRAYQTMASHGESFNIPPTEEDKPKDNKPTADKLESKELRDIYTLITELEDLEKYGVKNLHILKADSFVDSLLAAVRLEKSKI